MNSKKFFSKALLRTHALGVQDYLANNNLEEVDNVVADELADIASTLASRLTAEWESCVRWSQSFDDDVNGQRENSTTDLTRPFEPCDSPSLSPSFTKTRVQSITAGTG